MKVNCSVLVLAGGNSERMKFPKPFLQIGKVTFSEKICDVYRHAGVKEIYAVMNKEYLTGKWESNTASLKSYVKFIENTNQELGRFHSVKLGAEKMKDADYCFIQNIDNPFISEEVISLLWNNRIRNGYVSPVCNMNSGHPILISNEIIRWINDSPDENISLRDVLKKFQNKKIETKDEMILCNINTKEDFEKYIGTYELK